MPVVGTVIHPRLIIDPRRSDFNLNVPLNGPLNIREDAMQPPASSFFLPPPRPPDNNLARFRSSSTARWKNARSRKKEEGKEEKVARILVDRLDGGKKLERDEESNSPPTHRIRTVN